MKQGTADTYGTGPRIESGARGGGSGALLDQDRPEIVDVCQRRAGDDEVAYGFEERIGIVVVEIGPGVHALGARPLQGVGRDDGAGVVFRTVDAVRVAGDGVNAGRAIERDGKG